MFTGTEDHKISFADGHDMTKRYRDTMSSGQLKGGYFSQEAIQSLLDQKGCVGIRFYYGYDEDGKQVLVLVGVKEDENDLVGPGYLCMEMSTPCPDQCGDDNVLNS